MVQFAEEVLGTGESSAAGGGGAGDAGTGAECEVHPLPQSTIYDVVGIAEIGAMNSIMAIGGMIDKKPKIHSFVRQSVDHTIYRTRFPSHSGNYFRYLPSRLMLILSSIITRN